MVHFGRKRNFNNTRARF